MSLSSEIPPVFLQDKSDSLLIQLVSQSGPSISRYVSSETEDSSTVVTSTHKPENTAHHLVVLSSPQGDGWQDQSLQALSSLEIGYLPSTQDRSFCLG